MTVFQIFLLAFFYALRESTLLWGIFYMHPFASVSGLVVGLILGHPVEGVILGAAIQTLNMAPVTAGATVNYDLETACFVAIPLALTAGLDTELALTLAIPFAVIGTFFTPLARTLNSFATSVGDKMIEKGNIKGLTASHLLCPLINFPFRFIPMFMILLLGSNFITVFVEAMPMWLLHGLQVTGGVLPAVGFAMFLYILGKGKLLPYFLLGFYVAYAIPGINTVVMAIFGAVLAITYFWFTDKKDSAQEGGGAV